MLKKNIQRLHKIFLSHLREAGYIALVAIIGSYMLISSHAASPEASVEAETGSLSGNAIKITNSSASGGLMCSLVVTLAVLQVISTV
jgi:hypothetical protein